MVSCSLVIHMPQTPGSEAGPQTPPLTAQPLPRTESPSRHSARVPVCVPTHNHSCHRRGCRCPNSLPLSHTPHTKHAEISAQLIPTLACSIDATPAFKFALEIDGSLTARN